MRVITLDNGLQVHIEYRGGAGVLVKENGTVAFDLRINGGVAYETPDKPGVFAVIANMFNDAPYDMDFKSKGGELFFTGFPIYNLNAYGSVFSQNIEGGIEKISNIFKDGEVFTEERMLKSIDILHPNIKKFFKKNSYAFSFGSMKFDDKGDGIEVLMKNNITVDDIKNYYSNYFNPNNAVLSIVGDLDEEEIEQLVLKHLSPLKKGKNYKDAYEFKTRAIVNEEDNGANTIVSTSLNIKDFDNNLTLEFYLLEVLLEKKLIENIRWKKPSLAYYARTSRDKISDCAYIRMISETKKGNEEKIIEKMGESLLEIITNLNDEDVVREIRMLEESLSAKYINYDQIRYASRVSYSLFKFRNSKLTQYKSKKVKVSDIQKLAFKFLNNLEEGNPFDIEKMLKGKEMPHFSQEEYDFVNPKPREYSIGVSHVEITVLDNGFKIITQQKKGADNNLTVQINSGSQKENPNEDGVAHFLEHCIESPMFHNRTVFKEYPNAYTSINATCYDAYTVKESDLKTVMNSMFSCIFYTSNITEYFIANEKEAIVTEKNDKKEYLPLERMSWSDEFAISGPIIGDSDYNILNMTLEQLQNFYHRNYVPNNAVLYAVGNDIDHNKIVEICKETFGTLEPKELEPLESIPFDSKTFAMEKTDSDISSYAAISFDMKTSSYKDRLCLDVLSNMLRNKLKIEEKNKKIDLRNSLTVFNDQFGNAGSMNLCFHVKEGESEIMQRQVLEVMDNIKFTEEDLVYTKSFAKKNFNNDYINNQVGPDFLMYMESQGKIHTPSSYKEALDKITLEDIDDAFKRMKEAQRSFGMLDNIALVKQQNAEIKVEEAPSTRITLSCSNEDVRNPSLRFS